MAFILQTRRSVNRNDDIQEWLYQDDDDDDASLSQNSVSATRDLSGMDLDDEGLGGFGNGFEDNNGDEDSQNTVRDEEYSMADSDEYASSASGETDQEDTPEYDYRGCERTSFSNWGNWQ